MTKNYIKNEYFEWLYEYVCGERFSKTISYRKLLMRLHDTKFRYTIPMDSNREEDGVDLRWRFASRYENPKDQNYVMDCLIGLCSVLEMMVALAIRCEENIMDDPNVGDRTGQWFWGMIRSLGLGDMTDDRFDRKFVDETIERFLNRDYEPNGKGGLFTIKNCKKDLRTVEIWYQLCWYLNSIIG